MSSRICFVSPYSKLTDLLKQTLGRLSDAPQIVEDTMGGEQMAARMAEKQGAEVFVTTNHHTPYLKSKVTAPIVSIPLTLFDVTQALSRAKVRYGDPVALLEPSHNRNSHLTEMREILACEIKNYAFVDENDASAKIVQAKFDGCRSGVGGGIPAQAAQNIGFAFVPLFPGIEAITAAFRQAQQIAEVQRAERSDAMKFKYTVEYAFTGIIITDKYGKITVFNSTAERILMVRATQVMGRSIEEIIPRDLVSTSTHKWEPRLEEIKTVGHKQLVVNTIPILDRDHLEGTIFVFREVAQIQSLEEKIRRASHERGLTAKMTFDDIVAVSGISKETLHCARRFAASGETVLITGETGTGKEIFAQSMHNGSRRRAKAFVAVSCATIPPSLLESELFGYTEGAFTGARRGGKAGFFELTHGGTIFLDEIGELSPEAQVYLLRVIQEKEVMRIGDTKVIPVDVRVIAATNKHLEEAVRQGRFRLDLYYRLNVLQLALPPLRERFDDLLPLLSETLRQICPNQGLAEKLEGILANHKALLYSYPWPGNVRELQNLARRLVVSSEMVGNESLESEVDLVLNRTLSHGQPEYEELSHLPSSGDLKELLSSIEQEIIMQRRKGFTGSKTQLAKKLGIGRSTLWRKLNNLR